MTFNKNAVRELLRTGDLRRLFVEELGWDRGGAAETVRVDEQSFELRPAGSKRGLVAYVCSPASDGAVPPSAIRRQIQRELARQVHEHLIVFVDHANTTQVWQWVKRELGKPLAVREHYLHSGHHGEALLQKLEHLVVSLDEEDRITVLDVAKRVRLAFDVERPTRRFYDRFQVEHGRFLAFIEGIKEGADREWYASVMLNRLMFVYFIQKKGFLDDDKNYLRNRLTLVQRRRGKDQFHSFYRQFLLRLFYEGLGQRESSRPKGVDVLIGRVPYLNGGLFVPHTLEERYVGIEIPDEAFARVLDFFDEFQWHLDDRPLGNDNEINPEVLGYIFERYVNQKQMGAYYTKEDITEYIARSTILPQLVEMVRTELPSAFEGAGSVWRLLEADPDRYVLPSLRVGEEQSIPGSMTMESEEAATEAEPDVGLPRETWRGVLDRRHYTCELRRLLRDGCIRTADALVTHNIDIRQFVQDVIDATDSPELVRAFYKCLRAVTIIDPACGSGAFLFAAMNILEPLYEAALDRMGVFIAEAERRGWSWDKALQTDFRAILSEAATHRNRAYFIYRSIAVNNLFGVDLMEEATEICKLRLFLKLAAQVEEYGDIEPLPDIDFNIRAGNSLVGYTHRPGDQDQELDLAVAMNQIERELAAVDGLFRDYKAAQLQGSVTSRELLPLKRDLSRRLAALDETLNKALAGSYSIFETGGPKFKKWANSHAPFHWWANFYGQMESGGFDVVLGNPPYIQSTKVRKAYSVKDLATGDCPDIYAWMLERAAHLVKPGGRSGMIVPLSLGFSSRFDALRSLLKAQYAVSWYSHYGRIPSALFNYDVRVRNTIHIGRRASNRTERRHGFTTRLHRWFEEERPYLFDTLMYEEFDLGLWNGRIPKVHSARLIRLFEDGFRRHVGPVDAATTNAATQHVLYFKKSAYNWLNFCRELPPCYDAAGRQIPHTKFGEIYFRDARTRDLAFLLLNGKWEFGFWYLIGDDFDVTRWMFGELPANLSNLSKPAEHKLHALVATLEAAMNAALTFKLNAGKRVGNYNLARCRHVTDQIDQVFGEEFGWMDAWPEAQLLYSQAVKTTFDADDE